ncbi:MAG: 30S ribosomal protein S4 [Clostridia bacterium]|nr:30S ribosomal protein S4 [Clostridia bacterium]
MARNIQPIVKRCRALGISPAEMGYTAKSKNESTKRNPGANKRGKKSEYAAQLAEKQKVKFVYGILEKQFRKYYEKAARSKGITGEVLLTTIERRLDNVVFRMGLATTRKEARQMVTHAHFTVNGKKVNIPSYLVSVNDVIALSEKSKESKRFSEIQDVTSSRIVPQWLSVDSEKMQATVTAYPVRTDIDMPIQEHLIVELYSK